jgi:hypothetical protein
LENAEAVAVPKMVNILTAWGKFIQSFVEVGNNINATELFGNSSMEHIWRNYSFGNLRFREVRAVTPRKEKEYAPYFYDSILLQSVRKESTETQCQIWKYVISEYLLF